RRTVLCRGGTTDREAYVSEVEIPSSTEGRKSGRVGLAKCRDHVRTACVIPELRGIVCTQLPVEARRERVFRPDRHDPANVAAIELNVVPRPALNDVVSLEARQRLDRLIGILCRHGSRSSETGQR